MVHLRSHNRYGMYYLLIYYQFVIHISVVHGQFVVGNDRRCELRPKNCELICPNGYQSTAQGICLCACYRSSCQAVICASNQICLEGLDGNAQCVQQIVSQKVAPNVKPGFCPRISGGICMHKCLNDAQCFGSLKCCFNGCGFECILAIETTTQFFLTPIQPLLINNKANNVRIGVCPNKNQSRIKCERQCNQDSECPEIQKCCDLECGKVCIYPEKSTNCVHLHSAAKNLPNQTLTNGYLPKCDFNGNFNQIQCDKVYCWCVDVYSGVEVFGTKTIIKSGPPNCKRRKQCSWTNCRNNCPFGLKTDQDGCPIASCECKNICENVECLYKREICQLVPSDCIHSRCIPLPKCLINPCSSSSLEIPKYGLQIFCSNDKQCSQSFWCNKVGYNGMGFCCPSPRIHLHAGQCPADYTKEYIHCDSYCQTDNDCRENEKCCFVNCGLRCISINDNPKYQLTSPFPTIQKMSSLATTEDLKTDVLLESIAKCPTSNSSVESPPCRINCRRNSDCPPLKICCSIGCSAVCVYPMRTTACIHEKITAKVLGEGSPQCDPYGNYREHQCYDGKCFCVDVNLGYKIPSVKTSSNLMPICQNERSVCNFLCEKSCTDGYERSSDGCPICKCKNPCAKINCSNNQICVLVDVICLDPNNCPRQPRCIKNICPNNNALNANFINTCQLDNDCPPYYWCYKAGFGPSGICCPNPKEESHSGRCPILLSSLDDNKRCETECNSDRDCSIEAKCCFSGCGKTCSAASSDRCPSWKSLENCWEKSLLECINDQMCSDKKKCCDSPCGRRCIEVEEKNNFMMTSDNRNDNLKECLYLKQALSTLETINSWRCKSDGSFEEIQCNKRFCWCSSSSGKELEGTRVPIGSLPNCKANRLCPLQHCPSDLKCIYGLKKDSNGCDMCFCHNPCEEITCPKDKQICIPQFIECPFTYCPPISFCTFNPCHPGLPVMNKIRFSPIKCSSDNECATLSKCQKNKGTDGFCCWEIENQKNNSLVTKKKNGECPLNMPINNQTITSCITHCTADSDCADIKKCCTFGCHNVCLPPQKTTNCILYRAALLDLSINAKTKLPTPICNDSTGLFNSVQCDGNLNCWCVDPNTGFEFYGTRRKAINESDMNVNACARRKACDYNCDEINTLCVFGYEIDAEGCPINKCTCKNPCNGIQCMQDRICVMRSSECDGEKCISIPICVKNICPHGKLPMVDPFTLSNSVCSKNNPNCLKGSYCSLYDDDEGICCSLSDITANNNEKETNFALESADDCIHGEAFSSSYDGSPVSCSPLTNSCPSTHYCYIKPQAERGKCCVAKDYVCSLEMDKGSCDSMQLKFFYDPMKKSCSLFNYTGCLGNLNNFISEEKCENFCANVGLKVLQAGISNKNDTIRQIGFTLIGPEILDEEKKDFLRQLGDYVKEKFAVGDELRDLTISKNNTIRFSLIGKNASIKAQNISDAITSGQFEVIYGGEHFRPEPRTFYNKQVSLQADRIAVIIFWMLLIASALFAIIIIFALYMVYCYLGRKKAYSDNADRSPRSNLRRPTVRVEPPSSTNDENGPREIFTNDPAVSTQSLSVNYWQNDSGQQTPGGRRRSRTTLYY